MNCTESRQAIDQLPMGSAPRGSLAEHLDACDLCQHYYTDRLLEQELSSLEVPQPSDEFLDRAIKLAAKAPAVETAPSEHRWRWPSAMAASVLVAAVGFISFWEPAPLHQENPTVETAAAQPEYHREQVRIVIYSNEAHENAELSIELAENLELEGYTGRQQLAWSAPLNKGANVLNVPVLVRDNGGEVRVISHFGGKSHEVKVQVSRERQGTGRSDAGNTQSDRVSIDLLG
ncbi:hypothetical protein [Marinimicrobium sp. ABcell2]|uniref:hypothetical protein n=1 Tax=Marinimicrobium sp. ABcell2 TaxID=3069751 RepID=UPI0027AE94D7|nr:hypothetical protein [Marinimicrobium sp. ABcell2]MDQ2076908.1 hypothetical protein [Marinimicrobium sp. ABcell2]